MLVRFIGCTAQKSGQRLANAIRTYLDRKLVLQKSLTAVDSSNKWNLNEAVTWFDLSSHLNLEVVDEDQVVRGERQRQSGSGSERVWD